MNFSAKSVPRLSHPLVLWRWHSWLGLAPDTLYAFLKLRSDIFVVEQNCVFPEMDGLDPRCEHLCGTNADGRLLAYLRLVPPGIKFDSPSLGRVVVERSARGSGIAHTMMLEGLRRCSARYPRQAVLLSAQQHLEGFYSSLGFRRIGEPYMEDGIPHIDMRRPAILETGVVD